MPKYDVKQSDGVFVACVDADSPEGTVALLSAHVSESDEMPNGEVIFLNMNSKFVASDELGRQELLAELVVTERPEKGPTLKGQVCAYCGINKCTSREGDHVIARGFFDEAKRTNAIVPVRVPACDACNGEKSALETVAIPLISLQVGPDHPDAGSITAVGGPVHRSFAKIPKIWKRLLFGARDTFVPLGATGILVPTLSLNAQWPQLRELIQVITKGLYYYHTNKEFPAAWDIVVTQIDDEGMLAYRDLLLTEQTIGSEDLGGGVCTYVIASTADGAFVLTILTFYGKVHFVTKSMPEKKNDDILVLKTDMQFASKGEYILRAVNDDQAELSKIISVDNGEVRTAGSITVTTNQLVLFQPTNKRVEQRPK